jgi:hypothetical protein
LSTVARGAWAFRAFGLNLALTTLDPELDRLVRAQLPPFTTPPRGTIDRRYRVAEAAGAFRLHVDERRAGPARDTYTTANRIVADLQAYLARSAAGLTFVHAGVVRVDGRAIVIAGRSGSGKSALVAAFVAAGAAYASDELAVLDRRGRAHPYPRPLTLRAPGGLSQRVPAGALAGPCMRRAAPVGLLLLPRYRRGKRWAPVRLSPGVALLELARHTLGLRSRPEEALGVLRAVAERAPALAGVRGEAEEVVSSVIRSLRTRQNGLRGTG